MIAYVLIALGVLLIAGALWCSHARRKSERDKDTTDKGWDLFT